MRPILTYECKRLVQSLGEKVHYSILSGLVLSVFVKEPSKLSFGHSFFNVNSIATPSPTKLGSLQYKDGKKPKEIPALKISMIHCIKSTLCTRWSGRNHPGQAKDSAADLSVPTIALLVFSAMHAWCYSMVEGTATTFLLFMAVRGSKRTWLVAGRLHALTSCIVCRFSFAFTI